MERQSDPAVVKFLARFVTFCSVLSAGFGVFVLAGCVFHIQNMKTILPGQTAVRANVAACFVPLGTALWLLRKGTQNRLWSIRLTIQVLAIFVCVVGLLSFLEYWYGWDLGIDQVLFTALPQDVPGSTRPGLMSPIASLSLLLLGPALSFLDWEKPHGRGLSQVLAVMVAIACMFGILEFVLEFNTAHTYIAPPAALVFLLFAVGLLCARTDCGVGRLLASTTLGGTLSRRLLPAAIIIPIVIAWLRSRGQEAGLYANWAGITIMTVSTSVLLAGITAWTAFVIDRTDAERRKAEDSVRRLASIFTSSNDAIVGKTLDGIVTTWNPGAEATYGYSAQEMIGRSITLTIPPDYLDDFRKMMQQVARGEHVRQHETLRLRKDGQLFHVSLSVSPIKDEAGKIVGASTIVRDIAEHKQAEQALRNSEEAFRTLANLVPQMVWMCTPDGLNTYFNQRWVEYTGLTLEQSYGRGWNTPFHPDDKQAAWDAWNHATATGDPYRIESRLRAADGSYRWFLMRGVPLRDAAGNVVKWFGTCTDIHDMKLAEAKLREASAYTRSLIEASLDPLVTISREGKISDVNEATEKITGVPREQLIGSDFSNYFTEPEKARSGYEEVFARGFVHDYPLAIRHTSGQVTHVLYNASVFKNERGEIGGVFAAARDITERKRAEEALNHSETRYRSLVTATTQIVWTTNAQGEVVDDMPTWRAFTGFTLDEIKGSGWINSLHPEDRERTAEVWSTAVSNRTLYDTEYRLRRHDGEYRDVAVRGVPVLESNGAIREWIGTCTDITERKRTAQALQVERQRFREVLDRLPVYVVLLTPDYHVALDNSVFRQRFGESQGRRCYEFLFGRSSPCEICETYKVLPTNSPQRWKWTGPDGRRYDIFDFPFPDSDGSPLILEMGMDVTERERAEEEVRRLNQDLEQRVKQRTAALETANKRTGSLHLLSFPRPACSPAPHQRLLQNPRRRIRRRPAARGPAPSAADRGRHAPHGSAGRRLAEPGPRWPPRSQPASHRLQVSGRRSDC